MGEEGVEEVEEVKEVEDEEVPELAESVAAGEMGEEEEFWEGEDVKEAEGAGSTLCCSAETGVRVCDPSAVRGSG